MQKICVQLLTVGSLKSTGTRAQALILFVFIAISSRNLHVTIQAQCAVYKYVTAFVGYILIPFLDQTTYRDISFLMLLTTSFVHLQFSLKV